MSTELWRQALLPPTATIQHAIRNLDLHGLRLVLVTSDSGELLGTLSDGDIRRGLLRGLRIESQIEEIVFRGPLVVPPNMSRETVLHLMTANKIQQIPIVDSGRHVIGLHLWDEVVGPSQHDNTVVIMAGGKGTRLRPLTEECPKPMLLVGGRPMLEHIIERAKHEGFTRFVIAIQYLGHMIEDHFGNGERFGVSIEYLREEAPLGTAGALSLMARTSSPFIVTNGDLITDVRFSDLLNFHIRHGAVGTMAVRMHEWQHPFGVVETDGVEIIGFEEKPIARRHINAGFYVLDPDALDSLNFGERCDMPELFLRLRSKSSRIVAYPMHEPWLDVGRPSDLELARVSLSSQR
jgi:dTDP-glucose pyrophosphorylase